MIYIEIKDLDKFNLYELNKILNIQIQNQNFENASLIRDFIENKKNIFNNIKEDTEDTEYYE